MEWHADRIKDDPLWIFCCCGCLPVVGIFKSFVIIPLVFITNTFSCTLISLIALPMQFVYTYYMISITNKLSCKIKILALLFSWIPIILWPIICCIAISIACIFAGFILGQFYAFHSDYHLFYGGFSHCIKKSIDNVKLFWDYSTNKYTNYLKEYLQLTEYDSKDLNININTMHDMIDISIFDAIVALLCCLIGIIFDFIATVIIGIIFVFPLLCRFYFEYINGVIKGIKENVCMCLAFSPIILIVFLLIPIICVGIVFFVSIGSIFFCISKVVNVGYTKGFKKAMEIIIQWIKNVWQLYYDVVYCTKGRV